MQVKYSYILAFILMTVSIINGQQVKESKSEVKTQAEKVDVRTENLKKQVARFYETIRKPSDFEKMADLTYPKVIEIAGSRENYIAAMKKIVQMSDERFESFEWMIGKPNDLVEIGGYLFGVVPRTLTGISFLKDKIVQEGTIVGVSIDNGKSWKFVNGTNFKSIFPSFADKIKIPEQISFVNGIKQ